MLSKILDLCFHQLPLKISKHEEEIIKAMMHRLLSSVLSVHYWGKNTVILLPWVDPLGIWHTLLCQIPSVVAETSMGLLFAHNEGHKHASQCTNLHSVKFKEDFGLTVYQWTLNTVLKIDFSICWGRLPGCHKVQVNSGVFEILTADQFWHTHTKSY